MPKARARATTAEGDNEMTKISEAFIQEDYSAIKEMVLVLWGADVDELEVIWVEPQVSTIIVPIMRNMLMEPLFPEGPIHQPRFLSCFINIDRWLLPWRLKAGCDPQHNILALQWHNDD